MGESVERLKPQRLELDRLVARCESVLESFNPVKCTLDAHAADVLGADRALCLADRDFVEQVLYGSVRYRAALKPLLASFFHNHSATTSRGDYTKYAVLGYLALFRLDDVGFAAFASVVRSQAAEKMHVFLTYLFDVEAIERWVKDAWIQHYDLAYVEQTLVGGLQRHRAGVAALCEELSHAAFGVAVQKEAAAALAGVPQVLSKPPTIPRPFNITPARPVRVPLPLQIKQGVAAKPVPSHLNDTTLATLGQEREATRARVAEATKAKYERDASFKLSETKDTLTKAVEAQELRLAKIMGHTFSANPVPDFESKPSEVRMTTSAILREDIVYKKKQEQEASLLQAFEAELRDSTDFYAWQTQMRERDAKEKLQLVERRRLECTASQEEARLASDRKVAKNRAVATGMKTAAKLGQAAKARELEAVVEEKRRMAETVKSTKDAPAREKDKISRANRALQRGMRQQQRRQEEEKRAVAAREQLQRNDRIRQIRAIERVPVQRVTCFDPTECGNHGLLDELSMLETKERLAMNEAKRRKEHSLAHRSILQGKVDKEAAMKARLDVIRRARSAAAVANKKARRDAKERDAERQRLEEEVKEEAKLKLLDKLVGIRSKREQEVLLLREEEERVTKQNQFLGAAKDMVEEKAAGQVAKGLERVARAKQAAAQEEAAAHERIRLKDEAVRVGHGKRLAARRRAADAQAGRQVDVSKRRTKEKLYEVVKEKRGLVKAEHARYDEAQAKLRARNAYATSMASGAPVQVLQGLDRQGLATFMNGKPLDVCKTVEHIWNGARTLDLGAPPSDTNFATISQALDAVHSHLSDPLQ